MPESQTNTAYTIKAKVLPTVPALTHDFSLKGKICLVRLFRLGHIPPAHNTATLLQQANLPIIVVEYGYRRERKKYIPGDIPRWRIAARWTKLLPRKVRPLSLFANAWFRMAFAMITKGRPKVLFAQGLQEQALCYLLHLVFRVPLICQVHEAYEPHEVDWTTRLFLKLEKFALRSSQLLLFPELMRESIYRQRYRYQTPTYLVFNCPLQRPNLHNPRLDLKRQLGLPKNAVLMGYFGGIGVTNAFEEAISALVEVPNLHFAIWGWADAEYLASLKKLAKESGLGERVHFLGELGKSKWEYIEACDFAYCVYRPMSLRLQHGATASNKLMEAMAAGIPVVTSSEPDFRAIVERYGVGVCTTSISANAMAPTFRRLTEDPELRQRMGQNARQSHLNFFHYEAQFDEALHAIKTLCS